MIRVENKQVRALQVMLGEVVGRLSRTQVAILILHPDVVCTALAVAAEALTVAGKASADADVETLGGGVPRRVSAREADRRLSARMREDASEDASEKLLTSDALAARIGLKTRQSVHNWLRKGKIVGWPGAKRGYVFPAAQFDERNRPIEGIERIVGLFGNGYAAWTWLTTPRFSLDSQTPRTLLANGEIDRVVQAAAGDNQGDFA